MTGTPTATSLRRDQGRRIRRLREGLHLSQHDLATSVGATKQAVSEWERGKSTPRPLLQVEIARTLETPWSDIFGLDDWAVA